MADQGLRIDLGPGGGVPAETASMLNDGLFRFVTRALAASQAPESAPVRIGNVALVADPRVAAELLRQPRLFPKVFGPMAATVGRSRLTQNGEDWSERRRLTQPALAAAGRTLNIDAVRADFADALDRQAPQDGLALQNTLLSAAIRRFWQALGAEADPRPFVQHYPLIRRVFRLQQASDVLPRSREVADAILAEGLALRAGFKAVLAMQPGLAALGARLAEEGAAIEGFDAPDELLTNFAAGTETSVASILWALVHLSRLPRLQERLEGELQEQASSPLLARVVEETFRFSAPIPILSTRMAGVPTTVAGRPFDANEMITISIHAIHRHPGYWSRPQSFDPDRPEWTGGSSVDKHAFIPFSSGSRVCGGMGLARLQVVEGLAAVLRRYRFEPLAGSVGIDYAITLRPSPAILRLVPRERPIPDPAREESPPIGCPAHG